MNDWIYLDHHATTPCAQEVVEAMTRMFVQDFGNASSTHIAGRQAAEAYDTAISEIAQHLSAEEDAFLITSGATESNNLALLGACLHPRQKRRVVVTLETEHPSVLQPIAELQSHGFTVRKVPVQSHSDPCPGQVRLSELSAAIDEQTALVSVMWANNEMGVLQPIAEMARLCHQVGALFHTDATQAIGRIPVNITESDVDLLSASAHKFYGPKGVGLLYVRKKGRRVRIRPQVHGGGQQLGLRAGTLNPAGAIGMATALAICADYGEAERERIISMRNDLWQQLTTQIDGIRLNGPPIGPDRLPGNLNCIFPDVEAEALMAAVPGLCCATGSACSSGSADSSHVLNAIGLQESEVRSSIRFGVGRGNRPQDIKRAVEWITDAHHKLRSLGKHCVP